MRVCLCHRVEIPRDLEQKSKKKTLYACDILATNEFTGNCGFVVGNEILSS